MQIVPYTPADADGILSMLADHVDYAPEQITDDAHSDDIAFFKESFHHENDGLIAFTLKDGSWILGFVVLTRQRLDDVMPSWCIMALFVKRDARSDEYAEKVITLLAQTLTDTNGICVAVHPAATQAIRFWREHEYVYQPAISLFSNADGERLQMYIRKSYSEAQQKLF